MDLQADNRIGFIYEETLTGFGKRNNPVSTSFPNGEGQHNFDGFDNIYVAYELEYITSGAYSIKRDIDRRAFLKSYFGEVVKSADVSDEQKAIVSEAINALSANPTTEEIDYIYYLLAGGGAPDKWDGKTVTLTNVQKSGKEYTLYIDDNNTLNIGTTSAAELGNAAKFLCKKENSGKYSLYNKDKNLYIIWRAGKNYGYNNNSGTIAQYNATYCDWSFNAGSTSIENTYYLVNKRNDGTTDGSIIIMAAGTFDAWSNSVGLSDNYSNLFRIDIVEDGTGIADVTIEDDNNAIYDLQGRKVQQPGKGIYIVNGKKIMIR